MSGRVLVIASWGGPRRNPSLGGAKLLELWEDALSRYKNNLDLIVIASQREDPFRPDYLAKLGDFQSKVPVLVMRHDAISGSYGGWIGAWRLLGGRYQTYYVFEDDYLPAIDNWDDIMASYLVGDVGYAGSLKWGESNQEHMAHACGVIRETAFPWSHQSFEDYPVYQSNSQILFSQMFVSNGFKLADFSTDWSVPFFNGRDVVQYGAKDKPALLVPAESIEGIL